MSMKISRLARRLARDERGLGMVEMALTAPLLLLLSLGMIDISNLVAANIDLEQAAQRTTDYALAERPKNSNTTYLRDEAIKASGLEAKNVTVTLFLECDGLAQDFNSACLPGESQARFASVAITRLVPTMVNWRAFQSYFSSGQTEGETVSAVNVTGDSVVRFQ